VGEFTISGTSIRYSNPNQVDQKTVVFPAGVTNRPDPAVVAGNVWIPNFAQACPQPGTYEATPPQANPVLFGKQPTSLSAGGIQIPNSTTTIKNPA
jgi:hypothetical protein